MRFPERFRVSITCPGREHDWELELAAATDGRKAVAYYDFTFAPPKSVSVYYAALLAAGEFEAAVKLDEHLLDHRPAMRAAFEAAQRGEAWP
jgi:hypothetical protein